MTHPTKATAIAAGVLAVLGGVLFFLFTVLMVVSLGRDDPIAAIQVIGLAEYALIAGTLLPGGVLLLVRRPIGRTLTIAGSALAIVAIGVNLVLRAIGVGTLSGAFGAGLVAGALLVVIPAAATLVLAVVRPTAAWCDSP